MKRFDDNGCFEKKQLSLDLRWSIKAISKASEEHEQGDNDNVKEKNRWTKFDQSEYSILSPDASGYVL